MINRQHISSRRSINRLVVLALVLCVFASMLGTNKTSATQQGEAQKIAEANAAATNVHNELVVAQNKKIEAEQRLQELERLSTFKDPDINSLNSLNRLRVTVASMFDATADIPKLKDQLDDAKTRLTAATQKLNTADSALGAPTTDAGKNAKSAIQAKLDAAAVITTELATLSSKIPTALADVYKRVATLADTANSRLTPFKPAPTEAPVIRSLFEKTLGNVAPLMQFQVDLKDGWEKLEVELAKVAENPGAKSLDVISALTKLEESVNTVAKNINTPIATLATHALTQHDTLFARSEEFRKDPARQARNALQNIKDAQILAEAMDKIHRIADSVRAQAGISIPGFDEKPLVTALEALSTNLTQLKIQTTAFQGLLSGDRSLWITEKIRLYYFTDIPRLVQTLNPSARLIGGDMDARRRAQDRLDKLRAAEDAQSEANGTVLSIKRRVNNIRQQLQQAEDDLNLANLNAQNSERKLTALNRRSATSLRPREKEDAEAEKTKREEERTAAQQRFDDLTNESTGLGAQLREAEAQLDAAQAAFERAANATIRAAQVESAAFANARDNAPFWFAGGDATSTDPAMRVDITSSTGGENAIFIRGRKEDILQVQDIIAKLDEPAPQARMTLWKIELNSDATQKGAERFNEALKVVEEELATTRAKIADTLSLLLGSVSEEAEVAAMDDNQRVFVRKDCREAELYRDHQFRDLTATDITGRRQRLKRYSLYSQQVRDELGVGFIDELGFDNPKQFGLKDPASATTLNEALIILLLTHRGHRDAILKRFEQRFQETLLRNATNDDERKAIRKKQGPYLHRLRSMLGLDYPSQAGRDFETTRQQQELIYAMRGPLLKHLVGRIVGLQSRVQEFVKLHKKTYRTTQEEALYQCLQLKFPKIFDTIHDEFPISAVDIMDGDVKISDPGDGTLGLERYRDQILVGTRIYNLRPSPARVAAADGMLDVFTKAFEDDIDREFVQPMLSNLRQKLRRTGIGFGVIQRTSVLATNRLVARVDPRATSELSVGQETNLLQGLQSISQLALTAQSGNFLGALGQLRASSANEKDAAEIYGITSGSAFQVTPIFDPTGQALRFRFDFVDTTLVREPRGTTNPRLPRVERHTVNTEVQLANLEIREVSRFESDAKIGLPTTYRGGLPILKDIPGLRPVPLIGWFIRRKGSNAIAQRSLIFAQTTMSPTIGDILDLFDTSLQRR